MNRTIRSFVLLSLITFCPIVIFSSSIQSPLDQRMVRVGTNMATDNGLVFATDGAPAVGGGQESDFGSNSFAGKVSGDGFDIIRYAETQGRGDINLNGIPCEVGDMVVFTSYFIHGLAAFTINIEGQMAATEINGDGIILSVADLVYLIRIIIGEAVPIPKVPPHITADFVTDGNVISVDVELGAAYIVLAGDVEVSLADGAAGMEMLCRFDGTNTRVLIFSLERGCSISGNILYTDATIISAEAASYYGYAYRVSIKPSELGLKNYPNPFNRTTTIELSLPVASDWVISIFNIAGQKVAGFEGHDDAGIATVEWEALDQASGIYFYKAEAGAYSAVRKMVLMK